MGTERFPSRWSTNMSSLLVVLLSVPSMLLPLATRPSHTTARMMCTAPKLALVHGRSPLALVDKVESLNTELGLTSSAVSIPSAVEAIAAMLGMAEAINGKPLIEQVNACYAAVFSTNGVDPVATTVVTGTFVGSEVASNLGPAVTRSDLDGQPEPEVPEIPGIPVKLSCVGAGTTGVVFELFPQLQKKFTAEELDTIAENAMSCIGDHWMMPECGSALWVLYKRVCDKDLDKLAEALLPENVADSREQIKRHM